MINHEDEIELDLGKLLKCYLRKWWLIAIAAVLAAAAACAISVFCIQSEYRAQTTIYINNTKEGSNQDALSSSNLTASQKLVSTYVNIVKSDRVVDKVVAELDGRFSNIEIKRMVSAKQVEDTEILAIYAVATDPEAAAEIANAMAKIAPTEITAVIDGSSAKVIDIAKVPTGRYSPSYTKNTTIGGVLGLAAALIYLTITFLMDVRIKDEDELKELFDISVLGQIPEFSSAGNNSDRYYRYEKKV